MRINHIEFIERSAAWKHNFLQCRRVANHDVGSCVFNVIEYRMIKGPQLKEAKLQNF